LTSTNDTAVTLTAACELGSHRCKGVVLSLTDAHLTPCACTCHGIVRDLPAAWAEQVAVFPPCDEDVDQVEDEEVALDLAADLLLERSLEDIYFAEGWS
jgi:hypothetical protein